MLKSKRAAYKGTLEEEVYLQFLHADLRLVAKQSGKLPTDVGSWEKAVLTGRFVLQVEASANVGETSGAGRTIKLLLTDGTTDVAAFELRKVDALQVNMVGAKLFLKDPNVRHGVILLSQPASL